MEVIENLFGLDEHKLETYQMIARAFVIFFVALLLIRVSGIRTLGKQSAFDNLTALILGAIMGRAIVSAEQPFFGSILATLVIMVLHRVVAWITYRSKKMGIILKGRELLLIKNGEPNKKNMKQTHITREDILETLRKDVNVPSLDTIKEVYLERSGEISFIKKT
jgi:uncharacterized membrane protein YcaP (DUF421 family)